MRDQRNSHAVTGQTLVELALVLPLLIMFLTGIISFGIGVFYQQQVANAAREAARYAAIHSATDPFCPTASWLAPLQAIEDYEPCDRPSNGWPGMRDAARSATFGMPRPDIGVSACWSSYWRVSAPGVKEGYPPGTYDEPAPDSANPNTEWFDCTIGGVDPLNNSGALPCPPPATSTADDQGSSVPGNRITVYVCYPWQPPLAGFLLLPDEIVLRATTTEFIHRQR